jgi:hypothetical protein
MKTTDEKTGKHEKNSTTNTRNPGLFGVGLQGVRFEIISPSLPNDTGRMSMSPLSVAIAACFFATDTITLDQLVDRCADPVLLATDREKATGEIVNDLSALIQNDLIDLARIHRDGFDTIDGIQRALADRSAALQERQAALTWESKQLEAKLASLRGKMAGQV